MIYLTDSDSKYAFEINQRLYEKFKIPMNNSNYVECKKKVKVSYLENSRTLLDLQEISNE